MTIVAIGWAYVVMMMAIAEDTVVAGIMTFLLYGALPVGIILYIGGAAARRRRRQGRQQQADNVQPVHLPRGLDEGE
ncbi:MAG: hypothetical protein ACRYGK_03720 [Janthinobacterium lividum]